MLLGLALLWPQIDLAVSGLFFCPESGFFLKNNIILNGLKEAAFIGSRGLALGFLAALLISFMRRAQFLGLKARAWAFLLLALLIGPGLIANVALKDQWGRARPREIVEFGGGATFTPAWKPTDQCKRNCSFVSGDAAFGFFLPAIAYVVPRRRRGVFWGLMAIGGLFAGARILMGAHFLSDVLAAMFLVLGISGALHSALFGRKETAAFWRTIRE